MNKDHITNLTGKYETKTEHITAITTGETKGACITTVSIKQGTNRSRKLTIKHKGSAHHQRNDSRLHNTHLTVKHDSESALHQYANTNHRVCYTTKGDTESARNQRNNQTQYKQNTQHLQNIQTNQR